MQGERSPTRCKEADREYAKDRRLCHLKGRAGPGLADALRDHRLSTPPRGEVHRGLKTIAFIATGAAGMWPVRTMWGVYWRAREHHADHYAANLGQADALSHFLDTCALENDLPVPFVWLTEHTHPPTEHRIDRLDHHPT